MAETAKESHSKGRKGHMHRSVRWAANEVLHSAPHHFFPVTRIQCASALTLELLVTTFAGTRLGPDHLRLQHNFEDRGIAYCNTTCGHSCSRAPRIFFWDFRLDSPHISWTADGQRTLQYAGASGDHIGGSASTSELRKGPSSLGR